MPQANAILAISSTDRYINNTNSFRGVTQNNQPVNNSLQGLYYGSGPYSNSFSITAPNALMNGYIEKIIVSQIQLQYNVPTIQPGVNDLLYFETESSAGSGFFVPRVVTIPYGFYNPDELAGILTLLIEPYFGDGTADFTVTYSQAGGPTIAVGFEFSSSSGQRIIFPDPSSVPSGDVTKLLKLYRLLGITIVASLPQTTQRSTDAPNFLYTPYIDILSDNLTNYQRLKDTDSSTIRRKGLISRLYLSGTGPPQTTSVTYYDRPLDPQDPQFRPAIQPSDALGSKPFVVTFDMTNPKVINWTPDTAINSLDFEMRDCYGDLLFVYDTTPLTSNIEIFNSEWQMTLLCVEKNY